MLYATSYTLHTYNLQAHTVCYIIITPFKWDHVRSKPGVPADTDTWSRTFVPSRHPPYPSTLYANTLYATTTRYMIYAKPCTLHATRFMLQLHAICITKRYTLYAYNRYTLHAIRLYATCYTVRYILCVLKKPTHKYKRFTLHYNSQIRPGDLVLLMDT